MTAPRKQFLDQVYDLDGPDETRALYDAWSESYDAEVAASGYVTPNRCAKALARCSADRDLPLLDIGCGTGLSGAAFRLAGFEEIDGTDLSAEMLEQARAKGVYRDLIQTEPDNPLPMEPGAYANIAAVGVFSPGHGPPNLIDAAIDHLPSGGCFVFSLNDHALQDPGYQARINEQVDCGVAWVEVKDYGAHLPAIGLKSLVYALRKA